MGNGAEKKLHGKIFLEKCRVKSVNNLMSLILIDVVLSVIIKEFENHFYV